METATEQVNGPTEPAPEPTIEEQLAATRVDLEQADRRLAEQTVDRNRLRQRLDELKRLEKVRRLEVKAAAAKKALETAVSKLGGGQGRLPLGDAPAVDVNAEFAAGCREAEAARKAAGLAADGPAEGGLIVGTLRADDRSSGHLGVSAVGDPSWRATTISDIGFQERTVELLDERVIPTAGEVVAIIRQDPDAFGVQIGLDIADCMDRFRNRLSPDQVKDFDACRAGGEAPALVVARGGTRGGEDEAEVERGKGRRKAKVTS